MNEIIRQGIRDTIKRKCKLPIELIGTPESPIEYPEMQNYFGSSRQITAHHYPVVDAVNKFYSSVFGWIKANPSNAGLADAISSVYLWADNDGISNRLVNTKNGHSIFFNKLIDRLTQTIILLGKRGSGKTFYLNYLLNTRTKDLYECSSKLIWYRVDATKIFAHNISHPTNESISLEKYLYIQIAYVTLKHREQAAVWKEIFSPENLEITEIVSSFCSSEPSIVDSLPSKDIGKLLTDFEVIIRQLVQIPPDELTKEMISSIIQDPKRVTTCKLVADTILTYITKRGFRPLFIIDGIDNIDFYHNHHIYSNFVQELRNFCHLDDKQRHKYGALHLVAMRNDTYDHLSTIQRNFWVEDITPFNIARLPVDKLVEKKREVATNTTTTYFKNLKAAIDINARLEYVKKELDANFPFKDQSDFDNQLSDFLNFFLKDISKTFEHLTSGTKISIRSLEDVLTYIYNDNFRSFLYNLLNVYLYHLLFVIKKNMLAPGDIKSYLITEGMILNGNLWLDSRHRKEPLSECIPNIFWFDPLEAQGSWRGLCLLRLMQYLDYSRTTRDEATEFLNSKLFYPIRIVKERFETAVAFGLIESTFNAQTGKQIFGLTLKGRLFLEYPFLDINQFYYMALDTPLNPRVKGRNLLIRFHSNKNKYWEFFTEAAVITGITLIRHIKSQIKLEAKLIPPELAPYFMLPNIFPSRLIEGMIGHMSRLEINNKARFKKLELDIEGILSNI